VLNIYCGITTGLHAPAVCGGVTGDIIAKKGEINLSNTNKIDYGNITVLVEMENTLGYEISAREDT
jgi:hypothetical protein